MKRETGFDCAGGTRSNVGESAFKNKTRAAYLIVTCFWCFLKGPSHGASSGWGEPGCLISAIREPHPEFNSAFDAYVQEVYE